MIEMICQRYHCTPAEAAAQPIWVLGHLTVLQESGYFEAPQRG